MQDPLLVPTVAKFVGLVRSLEFRTVSRWAWLCSVVGLVAGLAAAGFYVAMGWLGHMAIETLGNQCLLESGSEGSLFECQATGSPTVWLLVLLPALGGLFSGILVTRFAPEAEGHGTDALIDAFHKGKSVRKRIPLVKGLASIVVIGTGGSAGREGPIAQVAAGLASALSSTLKLSLRERRMLLLAGAAGGIAAIFQSPLGAALFVLEVLYRDDFEVDALVPTVISSVVGYSVFTSLLGKGAIFIVPRASAFDPRELPLYVVMAIGTAIVGALFIKIFYWFRDSVFDPLSVPVVFKPALGGLCVGLLSLLIPQAMGAGYGWVQLMLTEPSRVASASWMGVLVLLGIALAKILTTSLSVSSGGSGGVFGPSVVIGGSVGAAFGWAFYLLFPEVATAPHEYIIVGMACFVGGVARAPISTLVMACEMTGNYGLLVPLMLSEGITFALLRPWSLYEKQVPSRRESGAHSAEYILDVLRARSIQSLGLSFKRVATIDASAPLPKILKAFAESEQAVLPLVRAGRIDGLVNVEMVHNALAEDGLSQLAIADDCAGPYVSVSPQESLATALERIVASHCEQLPIVDPAQKDKLLGLLSYQDVLRAYSEEMLRGKAALTAQ